MDFIECKVCHVAYDELGHRPRNAPCGHELCSACIRALIKESIFECPKCREKHKVDTPEDMPVCFGLIDVIRAFKTRNIPWAENTEATASAASNDEVCNIHCKAISNWCVTCNIWICGDCMTSHSSSMGCSTTTLTKAMESKKETHLKDKDMVLATFDQDASYMSSMLQEHTKLAEKHTKLAEKLAEEQTKLAEKHNEEAKKLRKFLEDGNTDKEHFVKSTKDLSSANSSKSVDDGIRDLKQRKQFLQSWSVRNVGPDSPLSLPKLLKDKKAVCTTMVIEDVTRHAELSLHGEHICLHSFLIQVVDKNSTFMPFDRMQMMIPKEPSLVFLQLSIGGVVRGRVLIRLDKGLPIIRDNFVSIATGQKGPTMSGIVFNTNIANNYMAITSLLFSEAPVTPDSNGKSTVARGDVILRHASGYLTYIYFHLGTTPCNTSYYGGVVVGNIETGIDVIQDCSNNYSKGVEISDSGLILEQD